MSIAILLVVVGVVASVIRVVFRRPWVHAAAGPRVVSPGLDWVNFWATAAIVIFALGTAGQVSAALWNPNLQVDVRLASYWPLAPAGIVPLPETEHPAVIVTAGMDQAHLVLREAGLPARLLLAGGEGLIGGVCVLVAVLVRKTCKGALAGSAFSSGLRRFAWWVAVIVLVAGVAGQVLKGWGQAMAGNQALGPWGPNPRVSESELRALGIDSSEEASVFVGPTPAGVEGLSPTPFVVSVIIILFVELLSAGVRLAVQNARLAKDVEGLV